MVDLIYDKWNFASDDWHCPKAYVDLRIGGTFSSRMESRDGRAGFDFSGRYSAVLKHQRIEYEMGDGRGADVRFRTGGDGTDVTVRFDPDSDYPPARGRRLSSPNGSPGVPDSGERDKRLRSQSGLSFAAPGAAEKIAYGIPTFTLNGNLVHFSGYKRHIGFYPGPEGIAAFEPELAEYKRAKGSVQFLIDRSLPRDLIARIVRFRAEQNRAGKKA